MAILPIDLQTLFSQMDKVGKTQSEQTEGVQVQQALLNAAGQKKTETRVRTVNETQPSGDGPNQVGDKKRRERHPGERSLPPKHAEETEAEEPTEEVVRDPDLGKNIDLSG